MRHEERSRAERLLALEFPEVVLGYDRKDVILYALGLGIGSDPLSADHLRFVYEDRLEILPSYAAVVSDPGFWLKTLDIGIDYRQVVHGEQRLRLHRPLLSSDTVTSRSRVTGVNDKGPGRGAVILYEHDLFNADGLLATIGQSIFCRGDGGIGSAGALPASPAERPDRAPDKVVSARTLPQQALLYRLNADMNPLHADPAVATQAGYARPILHGLAVYGMAAFELVGALGVDPAAFAALDCRFRAPAFPGETLAFSMWKSGPEIHFEVSAIERNQVVLSNGHALLTG